MGFFPTRILLAADGSKDAALAARAASELAERSGSELHLVHAWRGLPGAPAHDRHGKGASSSLVPELASQELLEEQAELLEAAGAPVAGAHLRRGEPAEEIARLSEEIGAGLLVVGSRGLGTIARLVLGSVSEEVVYRASRPTLVLRGGAPPRRVVVGEDSSQQAKRAATAALSIGELFGAEAILVRTSYPQVEVPPSLSDRPARQRERAVVARMLERRRLKETLEERAGELEETLGLRPSARAAVAEDPAAFLLEVAEEAGEEATLAAVGSRGLGAVRSAMLGGVSRKVLRAARGPVLVAP